MIIGVDEVGRGCWAGPVVSACAASIGDLSNCNDSKALSSKKRKLILQSHRDKAVYGIGILDSSEVDRIGILNATFESMRLALWSLGLKLRRQSIEPLTVQVIVDGNITPNFGHLPFKYEARSLIKGDSLVKEISFASILAKVTRDQIMAAYAKKFPGYGLEKNAGYGVSVHAEAINKLGLTPIHRASFKPIRRIIELKG